MKMVGKADQLFYRIVLTDVTVSGYNVRLICVPSFIKTNSCVIVNLKNLECQAITLNVNQAEK